MDEDTMLELLAEYSGNWKERQYYEHVIREIQKKHHLSQLIQDHTHDPRDQLMLEASKRKTVIEIEKKYQVSTINSTYIFPRTNQQQARNNNLQINGTDDFHGEEDSYNNSLDIDFYNLKAQNVQKKKKTKIILNNELNKMQQVSAQHSKLNINQSQQSNQSTSLSPISRLQQQNQISGVGQFSYQGNNIAKGQNAAARSSTSVNKGDAVLKSQNNNNENQGIIPNQYKEDVGDEKNQNVIRNILNYSQDKTQGNNNNPHINQSNNGVVPNPLNNNNQKASTHNQIISPIKLIPNKIGVNEAASSNQALSPNQAFKQINQLQQQNITNQTKIQQGQQQQYQIQFLQNQIKQQQQAMLRTSQEDPQQNQKVKIERNNLTTQKDQQMSESYNIGVETKLNTCTNETERDGEIKSKLEAKSQSNSPLSKVTNGQSSYLSNYQYLSPQTNQQQQQSQQQQKQQQPQQVFSSMPNTQQPQIKNNSNLLNQQQTNINGINNSIDKHDFQQEFKQRIQQQFSAKNQKVVPQLGINLGISKNQNLSSGSGKEVVENSKKQQVPLMNNKKENNNKHSNAIEQILYRQQQYLNQPHQIMNTQESVNGNEDSSFSLNQIVQQSAKSQQQDSDQQQILKQIHNSQQNQNNIYSSKKLYQLNTANTTQSNQQSSQQPSNPQSNLIVHNKQRKLVQQNGNQQNQNSGMSIQQQNSFINQQQLSPLNSHSQQNIIVQNNSQMQNVASNDNISSNQNLEYNKSNFFNNTNSNSNLQTQGSAGHVPLPANLALINPPMQYAYLNDNVLSTQPYSEHQTSTNPLHINSEDILSQNSNGVDSQRKNSVRSKRNGAAQNHPNQEELEHRLSNGNNQNGVTANLQFSQTHSNQYKNKWIDFKKINQQQYKGSDRGNGAINQTQFEDNGQTTAANVRNTYSSVSPNGHQNSYNNKKGSSSINNYLSLTTAINTISNPSNIQGNSTAKNKQGLISSMTQSNHYQSSGTINSSLLAQQQSLSKGVSLNNQQNQSNLVNQLNNQQLHQNQELAAYQIKSGKIGITENQSVDKNYHTQFINNAKQFHQQQQFLLQQNQALDDPSNQSSSMSTKNVQRKQINKVNSCKSFEIRDKFSKTTSKNNTNNVIINLSNVNTSNHPQLYVQNLNHTTGNHNTSSLVYNNSNINIGNSLSQNNLNMPAHLNGSSLGNNTNISTQNKQNILSSSNITSYLPTSQTKNTYSAALYQKSQNNILSKQAKNPTENSMINTMHTSNSNNAMLSNNILLSSSTIIGTNGMNSSIGRNTSQNASSSMNQGINSLNLNSYLQNHNQSSNTKLTKKVDMYKVFNSTNSNSFSNQKDNQQSSVKQAKNLGLVLQKIIKNKTLKINEKGNQLNQQIQMVNNSIQNNIASVSNTNQTVKKQSTPSKKKMSNSGSTQPQNTTITNYNAKSPQYSSQIKKNCI